MARIVIGLVLVALLLIFQSVFVVAEWQQGRWRLMRVL